MCLLLSLPFDVFAFCSYLILSKTTNFCTRKIILLIFNKLECMDCSKTHFKCPLKRKREWLLWNRISHWFHKQFVKSCRFSVSPVYVSAHIIVLRNEVSNGRKWKELEIQFPWLCISNKIRTVFQMHLLQNFKKDRNLSKNNFVTEMFRIIFV